MKSPVLCAALLCAIVAQASAHPGYPARALIHIGADGRIVIHVRHDVLAFALNETPARIGDDPMRQLLADRDELRSALADGRERFLTLFELRADGERVHVDMIDSPSPRTIETLDLPDRPARLPIMLEFVAHAQLTAHTATVSLTFPEVLGDVIMTIERPGAEPFSLPLRPGERSPDFDVALPGAATTTQAATTPSQISDSKSQISDLKSEIPGPLAVAWRYIVLGITHIIPHGLDHMLFVLGLFFLSTRIKALLWQITAFTLAHSVTLTLATLNIVRLPADVVEPVIAASIAFVAIENILTTKVHPWRPLIVFAFGLVHGLGFAGALQDVGLPRGQLAAALVSFNIGVELGQITVIVAALIVLGRWRSKTWYRSRIAIPASVLIAFTGLWWTAQRTLGW